MRWWLPWRQVSQRLKVANVKWGKLITWYGSFCPCLDPVKNREKEEIYKVTYTDKIVRYIYIGIEESDFSHSYIFWQPLLGEATWNIPKRMQTGGNYELHSIICVTDTQGWGPTSTLKEVVVATETSVTENWKVEDRWGCNNNKDTDWQNSSYPPNWEFNTPVWCRWLPPP